MVEVRLILFVLRADAGELLGASYLAARCGGRTCVGALTVLFLMLMCGVVCVCVIVCMCCCISRSTTSKYVLAPAAEASRGGNVVVVDTKCGSHFGAWQFGDISSRRPAPASQ